MQIGVGWGAMRSWLVPKEEHQEDAVWMLGCICLNISDMPAQSAQSSYLVEPGRPFSLQPDTVGSLNEPFLRYRGHQTGQHGGPDRGDHIGRVPPTPLPLVCVQQQ